MHYDTVSAEIEPAHLDQNNQRKKIANDDIVVRDIGGILWRGRNALALITLLVTGIVAVISFSVPSRYEATVLMLPASDQDSPDKMGGLGGAAAQLGGIASLAGLSALGGTFKVEAVAILQSEALTERYIRENNLLPVLYSSKWDPKRMAWKSDDPSEIPTLWKANRLFRDRIRDVGENAKSGLVTMSITWRDPQQAALWANGLVKMANEYLRTRAVDEAERNIGFLKEQAQQTDVLAVQQAIANLTEAQLRKVMIARSRDQYALKVLDPATVPEKRSFPQPELWIPMAFFIGLFLAVLFVLMRTQGPATDRAERR